MSELRDMYPEERLAWRWAMFNDKAIVETEANPCVCTVSYDDMCAQPLEKSQQLMRFSNLAFDSQVEKFVRSSTRSDRRNYYGVYRDPVKAASSWQDDIDPRMIDRIVEVARHSLTWKCLFETGYERTEPKSDNGEVP